MSDLIPYNDMERMALTVAKSRLFGVQNPEQALALMLIAQAEGLHPAIAARDYHIIQGRPALKADAMLARFQTAGGSVRWVKMSDTEVTGEFAHPQGGKVEIKWTIEMANRAGLTKNPTWKQYPRAMLRARCISEGIRTVFPGVVVGTYTPEEVQDMDPPQMRDVTPPEPEVVDQSWTPPWTATILGAQDMAGLKKAFDAAVAAAKDHGDPVARAMFIELKDKRKAELTAPAPEPEVIEGEYIPGVDEEAI